MRRQEILERIENVWRRNAPLFQKGVVLILVGSLSAMFSQAGQTQRHDDELVQHTLDHKRALVMMGRAGKVVSKEFPAFEVVSFCEGSFKIEGSSEWGVALYNDTNREGRYIAVVDTDMERPTVMELARFSIPASRKVPVRSLEVRCPSFMEIKRIARSIASTESVAGTIMPISRYDSICAAQADSHEAFTCYSFDEQRRGFRRIGGWTN